MPRSPAMIVLLALVVALPARADDFQLREVRVSPLALENICTALGGSAVAPGLTIRHSPVAGQRIEISLMDFLSDGRTYDHGSTRVSSDASGQTVVRYAFLPPCNRTGGRINSDYRFIVTVGASTQTLRWGRYDSGARRIH